MKQSATDQLRRWANLVLASAQIIVTGLCFGGGVSFDQASGTVHTPDPPIVPAAYAFIIWSLIYLLSLAYGVYQFSSLRASDPLMRRIGWFTASGFMACCVWLILVRTGHSIWTVPTIYWMAASLFGAFRVLWRLRSPDTSLSTLVVAPISIYSGWLTIAIFANTSTELRQMGLGSTSATIVLLAAAALLATVILRQSRGNLYYAATICWALIGIGVRDQFDLRNEAVAITAWTTLILFAAITLATRRAHGRMDTRDLPVSSSL